MPRWSEGTAFQFYRGTPPEIRTELWKRFIDAIAPLKDAGKLGVVHFQFPPWLMCNREGHAHVEHCIEQIAGHTVSVGDSACFVEPCRLTQLRLQAFGRAATPSTAALRGCCAR